MFIYIYIYISCAQVHHVTMHHVPKCMSCHNAIVVITRRAHCFHDYIYVMPILLIRDLSPLVCCLESLKLTLIYIYIYIYILNTYNIYVYIIYIIMLYILYNIYYICNALAL